jgi:ABC-type glycerol-3-phosphate transport system substrate-binding protein
MFFQGGIGRDERGGDWKAVDYGFTGGQYAMVTVGPWISGHRGEDPSRGEVLDDTGIAMLPVAENGSPATYLEIKPVMVNAHTEAPEQAWQMVRDLTSQGFQATYALESGVLPARLDSFQDPRITDSAWHQGFAEYLDQGVALDPINWEKPISAIIEAIQATIYEESTVAEAASALHAELGEIAEEL